MGQRIQCQLLCSPVGLADSVPATFMYFVLTRLHNDARCLGQTLLAFFKAFPELVRVPHVSVCTWLHASLAVACLSRWARTRHAHIPHAYVHTRLLRTHAPTGKQLVLLGWRIIFWAVRSKHCQHNPLKPLGVQLYQLERVRQYDSMTVCYDLLCFLIIPKVG